jgi:hypothetical protein
MIGVDPLKPVMGQDGRMITAVVNQATLPKTPAIPKPDLYPGSVPETDLYPGSAIESQSPATSVPTPATVDQYPGSVVEQPTPTPKRGFVGNIKEAWSRGDQQVQLDREAFDAMMGLRPWEEVQKKRQALKELQSTDEIGKDSGFLAKSAYGVAGMLPPMLRGIKQGAEVGLASAAALGVAGQIGPQVATPEEVITMPAAFAAGNTVGQFEYWARQGTGQVYGDLRDSGVSHDVAKKLAPIGGLPYAAIEFSQVDKIIPGLGRKAKTFAQQTLMKGLLKLAGKVAANVGVESLEEAEQQIVTDTATAVGKYVDDKLENKDIPDEAKQMAKNAWQSFYQTLGPMALLQVPGASVAAGRMTSADRFAKSLFKETGTADDYRARIEGLGIPADQIGDYPDRFAAAKTPEEHEKIVTEFASKFKDVLPVDPIVGAQLDHLTSEIEKVRATAGETAAQYFDEKYLSKVRNGQPLTENEQNAANIEILTAIEDHKAGKSFQAPLQEPAMPEVGQPPVDNVQQGTTPAIKPISPPPTPTTPSTVETPAPAAAGVTDTQLPKEARVGAVLTSPATPTTENTTPVGVGQKPITSPEVGAGITLGTETKIHGTKGQEYDAKYAVVPRSELVASHDGVSFGKNPDYPLENARDYTNPAEQAKVLAVRNEFSPDRHVTDSTDASVGPVMVAGVTDEKGVRRLVVLGGNNREMAIQTMAPEKRQTLADFTNERAGRFGVKGVPDADHELVRFMGEYDLGVKGTREKLQNIIDSLNPSPGKVQSQSEMAAVDSGNIPIASLEGVEMDMDPKKAAGKVMDLIAEGHLDRNLRSQISEHPDQAQEYLRRVMVNVAFRDRKVADFVAGSDTKSAAARGLVEAATPGVVELRRKGQNELADAFSRTMATLADYVRKGDDLRTALQKTAQQLEMDPKMAIIRDVADVMRRNVAVSAKGKVIAEDSIENFNNTWNRINEGLRSWDSKPDMFGTKTTADDVIRNVLKKVKEEQSFENGEIRVSKGQAKREVAGGIKAKQGQYLVDEMMKGWKNVPIGGAVIVQSEADLDALGLSDESRQAILNSKAEGFYHIPTETVVIIADNLQRPSDAIRVMLHESIGHYGIRKVLGPEFEAELDRLEKLIPAEDLQKAKDTYGDKLAVEEYLAGEAAIRNPTLWQQFIKAVREALKRIGVNDHILDKWDTRGEIDKLIDTARDWMEQGEVKSSLGKRDIPVYYKNQRFYVNREYGIKESDLSGTLEMLGSRGNARIRLRDGSFLDVSTNDLIDRQEAMTGETRLSKPGKVKTAMKDFQERTTRAQDLVKDFKDNNGILKLNIGDGSVTVYHGTSSEMANAILKSKKIKPESFFSHAKDKSLFGSRGADYYAYEKNKNGKMLELKVDPRDVDLLGSGELEASEGLVLDIDGIWKSPQRVHAVAAETKPVEEAAKPEPDTRQFKLETVTPDQLRSEATLRKQNEEAKRRTEELQKRMAAPIKGNMGETTGVLLPGEGNLFRFSKGEQRETDVHKFSDRVSEDNRMMTEVRKALEFQEYAVLHNKDVIEAAKARLDKSVSDAYTAFVDPASKMKSAERVVVGQMLMQAHNEAARSATQAKDEEMTRAHLDRAIDIGHKLDEYGLEYGQGVQAFVNWNDTLSTAEGAQRMFERSKGKFVDMVLNKAGADIESVKNIVQEENAKAIDETLIEERVQERINTILDRLGSNARNGLPDRMKAKAGKQAAQDYFSRPENAATNDPDLRFSKAGEELDKKLFAAAKYGARVMWQNGNTSFAAFSDAMIKKSGPNIEKYLPRIYNESSILLNNIISRKPVGKGADTRNIRSANAELKSILKQWFAGDPNAEREPVLDLLKAAGMTEREAISLTMNIQHKFIERAQKAKTRKIQQILSGRIVPLSNQKAIRRLIELSNLTPLSDPVVREAIARAYNLPALTPEVAAKLDELAKIIKSAPEGFQQQDATRAMLNYMRKQMPKDVYDIGWGMWYANILSGYQTAERNFLGNAWNAMDNLATSMIVEPRNAPFALWGFVRGINAGAQGAVNVLKTGKFPARGNKYEATSSVELDPFTGIFKVFNAWKYVMRSLYGADMLFFKPAHEARAMMIAADLARKEGISGKELWRRTAEIMGKTVTQREAFRQQAIDEGLKGFDVKHRQQELAEQQRPEELIAEPMDYAQRVTFNYQPEGQLGVLARGISDMSRKVPVLRLAVPFTRIVANVANTTIDHTPWGFVRAYRGMKNESGDLQAITGHRRAQLLAKATMGTAAMAAAYILDRMGGDDDDDKKKFAIYGAGPGSSSKRFQLEETGWKPYTIKLGKHYFDYRLTPFAVPFAIIGNVRDAERWRKMDEKSILIRASYAVLKSASTINDMSFLSGVNQLIEMVQRDSPDSAYSALKSYGARNASTVIPALFKQIDRTFDENIRDNSTIQEALLREVPIASHLVKPKLNLLGEPVAQTAGPTSIFFSKERSNPVWKLIVDKEAWISKPATDTKIGDSIMDEDEYYQYVKESGEIIREQIGRQLPRLQELNKERAGKIIDDITQNARDRIKYKITRERWKK